jgi:hypothetical protein
LPAKQLVNLAFNVQSASMIHFEVFDALGERLIASELNGGEVFVQYSTASLTNGVYYWRLRNTERTIKSGKLVIMK